MKFNYTKRTAQSTFVRRFILFVGVMLVLGLVAWFGVNQWYTDNLRPLSTNMEAQIVTIDSGSSTGTIAKTLSEAGLIRNATAFNWYVDRLDDERFLQAGTYSLTPSMSVQEIVEILLDGRVDTRLVTIVPGLRLDEIETALIDARFDPTAVKEALSATYVHPLLDEKPLEDSLEGYIFPETYQVTSESTVTDLIEQSFEVFFERLDVSITDGLARQGLTLHEGIILASIVQLEVADPETQRKVAQVFLRRLDEGIPLGADPTFRYAAQIAGLPETVDIDSPYNTRIYAGLPPGPIANFNLSALEAVANPASTNFLFFVSGDDGNTYFSNTQAEHDANAERYCVELCQL